ncbi:helix-turn-helix domain-containing protein [Pedobacter sp.]|uniref:helix-turn-helix domain-containing protein n=1 Tax=Pedobacter sp. TaxID=1411316 RepID=UPI003D7F6AEA
MKNLNSIQQVAESLVLLRETHGYDQEAVATLLGLNVKEYSKLERGSRSLNLEHLCMLASFYKVRNSVILDFGRTDRQDTTEEIQSTLAEIEKAQFWLKEVQDKIAVLQMKLNKKKYA